MPKSPLRSYIENRQSFHICNEEIRKELLAKGWTGEKINEFLTPPAKLCSCSRMKPVVVLLGIGIVASLALELYIILISFRQHTSDLKGMQKACYAIDPEIRKKNEELMTQMSQRIEKHHDTLHEKIPTGLIPLSEAVGVIFHVSDLLYEEYQLLKVSTELSTFACGEAAGLSQSDIDAKLIQIRDIQVHITEELEDRSHEGTHLD